LVRLTDGQEIASAVHNFPSGENGIILDPKEPFLARQNPNDYLGTLPVVVKAALEQAQAADPDFSPDKIVGLGVDTTGSTPMPVNIQGIPLGLLPAFREDPDAQAWLWKDHTAHAEAAAITARAKEMHPEYLRKCGGIYSSEWFWAKIWHCLNVNRKVFEAAYTWLEHADWMTAELTGTTLRNVRRNRCAAGHKAMFNDSWGGYPARDFLTQLDPELGRIRDTLPDNTYAIDTPAGGLSPEWAGKLGLPEGLPVAMPAFDAHLGGVGSGIEPGTMVKILGTSTCDMIVAPLLTTTQQDIPGVCGIVPGSVLPDHWGLEAGQSAVGDIFNWWVACSGKSHEALAEEASQLRPGQSGLLALDWNNGNRCVLVNQRLTGLLLGQTLQTRPAEIYRALIEATAFGALTIINRLQEYGVPIDRIVNCGGIAKKSPLLMQIYADVTDREMLVSSSDQACALGAAIAGAVVGGAFPNFAEAQKTMCHLDSTSYKPDKKAHRVYQQLYDLYSGMYDTFGGVRVVNLLGVMPALLTIKEEVTKP
jgi:L-ribulokinase